MSHRISDPLESAVAPLQRRLRLQQRVAGSLCFLGALLFAVLGALVVDRYVGLPAAIRAWIVAAMVVGSATAVLILLTLKEGAASFDRLILRLERQFPTLRERLLSAGSAARSPHGRRGAFADALIRNAASEVQRLPITTLAPHRRLAPLWGACALLLAITVVIGILRPALWQTGLLRLVAPYGDVSWCQIEDRSARVVALGRPFELALRLQGVIPRQVEIRYDDGGEEQRLFAKVQIDESTGDAYVHELLRVQQAFRFRVLAGDAVLQREVSAGWTPRLADGSPRVRMVAPAHTRRGIRLLESAAIVECPVGSAIHIAAETDQELRRAWVDMEPLSSHEAAAAKRLNAAVLAGGRCFEFVLNTAGLKPVSFNLHLGFEAANGLTGTQRLLLRVQEDPLPRLAVSPRMLGEEPLLVHPGTLLPLQLEAKDALYGLTRLGVCVLPMPFGRGIGAELAASLMEAASNCMQTPCGGMVSAAVAVQASGVGHASLDVDRVWQQALAVAAVATPPPNLALSAACITCPPAWNEQAQSLPKRLGMRVGDRARLMFYAVDNHPDNRGLAVVLSREIQVLSADELRFALANELRRIVEELTADDHSAAHVADRFEALLDSTARAKPPPAWRQERAQAVAAAKKLAVQLRQAAAGLARRLRQIETAYDTSDLTPAEALDWCSLLVTRIPALCTALDGLIAETAEYDGVDAGRLARCRELLAALAVERSSLAVGLQASREELAYQLLLLQASRWATELRQREDRLLAAAGERDTLAGERAAHDRLIRDMHVSLLASEAMLRGGRPLPQEHHDERVQAYSWASDGAGELARGRPRAAAAALRQARCALNRFRHHVCEDSLRHAEDRLSRRAAAIAELRGLLRDVTHLSTISGAWQSLLVQQGIRERAVRAMASLDSLPEAMHSRVNRVLLQLAAQPATASAGQWQGRAEELRGIYVLLASRQELVASRLAILKLQALTTGVRSFVELHALRRSEWEGLHGEVWTRANVLRLAAAAAEAAEHNGDWMRLAALVADQPMLRSGLERFADEAKQIEGMFAELRDAAAMRIGGTFSTDELRFAHRVAGRWLDLQIALRGFAEWMEGQAHIQASHATEARYLWRMAAGSLEAPIAPSIMTSLPIEQPSTHWSPVPARYERDMEQYARDRFLPAYREDGARYFERLFRVRGHDR
jgi:hypothetical protein